MAGKDTTKAELQAELDQAHELTDAMKDLLSAVSALAGAVPRPADLSDWKYDSRVSDVLSVIKHFCDTETIIFTPNTVTAFAEYVQRRVDLPIEYAVYQQTSIPVTV